MEEKISGWREGRSLGSLPFETGFSRMAVYCMYYISIQVFFFWVFLSGSLTISNCLVGSSF